MLILHYIFNKFIDHLFYILDYIRIVLFLSILDYYFIVFKLIFLNY